MPDTHTTQSFSACLFDYSLHAVAKKSILHMNEILADRNQTRSLM